MHLMRLMGVILAVASLDEGVAAVDFVREVEPIFRDNCWKCHGSSKQEAAFRLDHRASALKGGDFGVAIVPGKVEESVLIDAVEGRNPKMRMPRKGDPLSLESIGVLKRWIAEGAVWPESASARLEDKTDHWAFKSPVKGVVKGVAFQTSGLAPAVGKSNPIDWFVGKRLEREGLTFSERAAPETLMRRLSLDLVGLPPSLEEVERFVAAWSEDPERAWEEAVERLLASRHYGERWGRHWLDAARYADSNGYEKDPMRHIWFYRDWVIQAFNRDLPYDQFVIEQLAGDQLPGATQDQVVATGFLRNSMINEEGGVNPEQFRMEAMFDRMDAIGKSVLGLTLSCTQCHDHKYDPISHEEYFQLFAFLNNDDEPGRLVYTPQEQQQRAAVHERMKMREAELKEHHPEWREELESWAASVRGTQPEWIPIRFYDDPAGAEKLLPQPDGSLLAQGYAPTKSEVKLLAPAADNGFPAGKKITAIRLELMNDANLPAYGPGRSPLGTCALTEFKVATLAGGNDEGERIELKLANATADYGEPENSPLDAFARMKDGAKENRVTGPVSYAIDNDMKTAWGIDGGPGRRNEPHHAVFQLDPPWEVEPGRDLEVTVVMKHGGDNSDDLQTMNLGRYRISYTTVESVEADPLPPQVRERVEVGALDAPEVVQYFLRRAAPWEGVVAEFDQLWEGYPEGVTSLVLESRERPRVTAVLKRGDYLSPGEVVKPGVPAVLNPLPKDADGSRLSLARWMVARDAPTTARAFVNRVWQAYFGTGLIETPEDLGTEGSPPSHPEMLDWLACEFMEPSLAEAAPWSIKHLHRLMVHSATYMQSSHVTAELLERDPYNRLLARGPRFRVEGEVVRDIQLAASGLIHLRAGGAPTMPPAPAFLFERPASYAEFPWVDAEGEEKYRRSVYTLRRRSTPYPFLATFDVPTGESSCVRRTRSNTPLQALMTLNETLSMEAAEGLGRRMKAQTGGVDRQLRHGFMLCTSREPNAREVAALRRLLEAEQTSGGKVDAYTVVGRVLLNLDETITKE